MIRVINVISDTNIGGAGKCLLTYLKYRNRKKYDVTVVLPRGSLLCPEIAKLGVRYMEIDGMADRSLDWKAIRKLLEVFRQEKPQIIHAHACMAARFAGRLYGRAKIIYTRHSVFEPSRTISRGLGKCINGMVNNATADRIIAVAEAAKDNLVQTGVDPKKIVVIKNGVEPVKKVDEEEKRRLRSNYNVLDGETLIGIAARLNEVKGHVYMVEALKMLVDDGFSVKLIIAGTGDYEPVIREKIRELGMETHVIMAGFVSDVTGLVNILDINLNASFGTEATSLALLEGMSMGIPAVVSDFGGNPGVIQDGINGFLFPKCDSTAMYNKIKLLLADRTLYQQMSENCVKIFESEFRAEIMTSRIEEVYKSLLQGKE